MTISELLKQISALYPKQATPAWIAAWGPHYAKALGEFAGPKLQLAWDECVAGWIWQRPPQPGDIRKCVDADERPKQQAGDDPPLPFGDQHFEIYHTMKRELVERWERQNADVLKAMGEASIYAASIAFDRAATMANTLMRRGFRHAPAETWLPFAAADWTTANQRHRSQLRFRSTGPDRIGAVIARHRSKPAAPREAAE